MSQPIIHRLLVVSPAQRFNEMLVSRLPASRFASPVFVKDASEARRRIIEESFDVILINTAANEESSIQLALDMADRTACGILLLVRQEQFIHLESRLTERGVYVVAKPTTTQILLQALQFVLATRERLKRLEQKNATIEEKMQEIRLVNQAKWLLIENRGMSEASAHRYIEKKAMDQCITRKTLAIMIIKQYKEE